jgi:hypothetical protein
MVFKKKTVVVLDLTKEIEDYLPVYTLYTSNHRRPFLYDVQFHFTNVIWPLVIGVNFALCQTHVPIFYKQFELT